MKLGKAAELLELSIDETLTYHRFPDGHWSRIRTLPIVADHLGFRSRRSNGFNHIFHLGLVARKVMNTGAGIENQVKLLRMDGPCRTEKPSGC